VLLHQPVLLQQHRLLQHLAALVRHHHVVPVAYRCCCCCSCCVRSFLKNINLEQNATSIVSAWPFWTQPVPSELHSRRERRSRRLMQLEQQQLQLMLYFYRKDCMPFARIVQRSCMALLGAASVK
jgi:hypothetical protein